MFTGRNTVRLALKTVPGLELEHWRRISPRRSVRPSARTIRGVDEVWQCMGEDVVWAKAVKRKTWIRQRYLIVRLPVSISCSIECHFIRSAVHVEYPWLALAHALGCILHHRTPALIARGHGVDRDFCK